MSEKTEWGINGCLWLSQDNRTPKKVKVNTHIANCEIPDENIPREFRRHWKKNKIISDVPLSLPIAYKKPPSIKSNKSKNEDIEFLLHTQN
jgi:hypothetical protein